MSQYVEACSKSKTTEAIVKGVLFIMIPTVILWVSCGENEPNPNLDPEPQTVAVSGVTLNRTTLSLETGASETLIATVAPSSATNKAVVWNSNNRAVATVDDAGNVTAGVAGTTTITVITADGGKTATCNVTVTQPKKPDNYIAFKFKGKDHLIANDENCIFSRRSEEYYTISGITESTKTAFTMTVGLHIDKGASYDIYASSIYLTSSIRILFTVGNELAEESFWTNEMAQVSVIGRLTITELTDERLTGTFSCRMMGGEIIDGRFTVKAKEYE